MRWGAMIIFWRMSLPALSYRPAVLADRDWLFELKRATMKNYVAAVFGWDEVEQRRWFAECFKPARTRIIQVEGQDAGSLLVEEEREYIFLAQIEVLPALQKRGVGSRVIRLVLQDAARKNKAVQLQVLRPNPARQLYERLGFVVYGETKTHFLMRARLA